MGEHGTPLARVSSKSLGPNLKSIGPKPTSVVLQGWTFWRSLISVSPHVHVHVHHERTTLSPVKPEHCRLVSLKIGATSLEGNSAVGSSMDFALSQNYRSRSCLSMSWNLGTALRTSVSPSVDRCVEQQQQHREMRVVFNSSSIPVGGL